MHYRMITAASMMTLALAAGACNREAPVEQAAAGAARDVDRAAALQNQRAEDLSKMDEQVAALERDYQEKLAATPSGTSGKTTTSLRDEVKSDMDDVKEAVSNLRSTTTENWWERHESAIKTAVGEVENDVNRFAGTRAAQPGRPAEPPRATDASGEPVSTAPFTSRRDRFVADMRTRLDGMGKALDGAKAAGPRKTERDDLQARVKKLAGDIDRLGSASADDWWTLSKERVDEYIDRVERSVARLDDKR